MNILYEVYKSENAIRSLGNFDFAKFEMIKKYKLEETSQVINNAFLIVLAKDCKTNINVGFLNVQRNPSLGVAIIQFLEILPNYRGVGIGTKLLNKTMKELKILGIKKVQVDDDSNTNFFVKNGFDDGTPFLDTLTRSRLVQ